jgi:hypothetical protein
MDLVCACNTLHTCHKKLFYAADDPGVEETDWSFVFSSEAHIPSFPFSLVHWCEPNSNIDINTLWE